ncbi:MAG: oligopeptidase A-like protein [Monoraphidium minutum]|nr:MAG: oligopeptidase A-like protein [Monoraphidium minutum]
MRRPSAPVLLALVVALAAGSAASKQPPRPRRSDARSLASQLPTPLWSSGLAKTWESVGAPNDKESAPSPAADAPALPRGGVAAPATKAAPAEDLSKNPILDETAYFPRWNEVKPHHVGPAMRSVLAQLTREFDALEAGVKPTYEGVLVPLEKIVDRMEATWGVVTHLRSVVSTPELRDAVAEVQPEVVAFEIRLAQSKALFDALTALKDGPLWAGLSAVQQRVVELQLRDFKLGGVGLTGRDRKRYNEVQQELAQLSTTFSNNVLDATTAFKKVVTDKKDLAGLSTTAVATAVQQARAAGYANAAADNGPWVFTLDAPSYSAVMTYATNRGLREELYRANVGKAASGPTDNGPVIEKLAALRREGARLLGFDSFAALSMATKMATLPQAEQLLEEMREAAHPAAVKELKELQDFAKTLGLEGQLQWWDVAFYSEKLLTAKYSFSDEDIRPYLALPTVLDGMFKLAKRLFDVDIAAADGKSPVWHPDVRFFEITSPKTGAPLAYFYVDPYSRPGEKRGGAWMNSVTSRSKVFKGPGAINPRLPIALAVMNSAAPVAGEPGLLKFGEMETLLHEFGHTLQHMLTTIDEGLVSGIRGVAWDAVELASQFMENWGYDKPTLMSFAKHHVTGAPLPEEMFDRLVAAKNFRSATGTLRQVNLAMKDLEIYSTYVPGRGENIFDLDRRVAAHTLIMQPLKEDRSLCSFGHIFTGGYSAGYYSYKWSEVLSADAFAAFEEAGLGDEAAVAATGRRYTSTVLALGGSVDPAKVFEMFRGRAPSTAALLRHTGLAKAAKVEAKPEGKATGKKGKAAGKAAGNKTKA